MQTNEMETETFSQRGEALFDSRLRAALDTPARRSGRLRSRTPFGAA